MRPRKASRIQAVFALLSPKTSLKPSKRRSSSNRFEPRRGADKYAVLHEKTRTPHVARRQRLRLRFGRFAAPSAARDVAHTTAVGLVGDRRRAAQGPIGLPRVPGGASPSRGQRGQGARGALPFGASINTLIHRCKASLPSGGHGNRPATARLGCKLLGMCCWVGVGHNDFRPMLAILRRLESLEPSKK